MKVAVLSDIHGNYVALQKCLEHAGEQKVDAYFFLGDYLGEFPYPCLLYTSDAADEG